MKNICILTLIITLFSCSLKEDKPQYNLNNQIINAAQRILLKHNKQIWNLNSIDTTDIKIYKACFLTPNDSILFISISGDAGMSAGNANRLNIIAHLNDSLIIDYYEQGALPDTIMDINNDGIDDVFFNIGNVWMGTCSDNYIIKSFANKKENILFEQHDVSLLDCGGNIEESSKLGDTLSASRKFQFKKLYDDKILSIIMTSEYKIHRGGKTEKEILDSIGTINSVDTIRIKKSFTKSKIIYN